MSKVSVIGGCGRLGLRFSLLAANNGHKVTAIDIDEEKLYEINQGCLPFVEEGAEKFLEKALKNNSLEVTFESDSIGKSDVVVISIGTPVDSNLNPSLEPVAGVIFDFAKEFKENQLIIFRNTLAPGITGRLKTLIEEKTGFTVGKNLFLVFAPEINQPNGNINNLSTSPQPIGAFDEKSFEKGKEFFSTLTSGNLKWITPEEALLAKLMTNMFKYVQAACANEFYLIAESYGVNVHNIFDACGKQNIPNPSLNASGPGMHKEGWFLVDRIPFTDIITTSFKINESIQSQIVNKLEGLKLNKIVILGMTSKANSDDPRGSLSYKLRKALYYRDYIVGCYDPFLPEYSDSAVLVDADAAILMTEHDEFKDLEKIKKAINNPKCIFIDINGFWEETRNNGKNGILNNSSSTNSTKNF